MNHIIKEFREFIARGDVLHMAVGVVIGLAFGAIVKSLVADVIMPPVGLAVGGVDFNDLFWVLREGATPGPYATIALAQKAGAVTLNYGVFVNTIINFLIVAFAVFLFVRYISHAQKLFARKRAEEEAAAPTTKDCPRCCSAIPIAASRCPHCTSELGAGG